MTSVGTHLVISQNGTKQNIRSISTSLWTRVLSRIMTDAISTWHEDHRRRAMLARVDAIMPSATRHQLPKVSDVESFNFTVPAKVYGSVLHTLYTILVEVSRR